ncbi:MAG: serine/threonine-protein kinase [Bdellovibrionota bacterium]|nr:serine/threonine-protein kinase [Bdellovibrionota bacterium]
MSEKFERFGQYLILDHLLDGGMAKICRARILGEQADKIVAIKMVQEKYSKDESFKKMFLDEIKTTFGLIHPNIVQTYNSGLHQKQLFVAMEYCDGRNLKEFLDKLKEKSFVFPIEVSVFVTIQAAQGLHYAHTFTDKLTGKPMGIVHRDISPHNIMLNFDGSVKVIDFGIAKSESNSDATQAGTIKGKLSYLAPEYLEQLKLDSRYDQFALGITLWELLCSRKLFKASNDYAVFKKIQECKIPRPSSINPNVPEELDRIVLKALSKDRDKRYKSCEEFARDLNKFLYSHFPEFNPSDLSYFAKELFKEEIKVDREKLFEYGKINITPYEKDYRKELAGSLNESENDDFENKKSESNGPEFNFHEDEDFIPERKVKQDDKESSPIERKGASFTKSDDGTRKENELVFEDLDEEKNLKPKSVENPSLDKTAKSKNRTKLTSVKKNSKQTYASTGLNEPTLTTERSKTKSKTTVRREPPKMRERDNIETSEQSPLVKIAMITLVVGGSLLFAGKDKLLTMFKTNAPDEIAQIAKEVIEPESVKPILENKREPSSDTAEIKFKNINRTKDKVYVNGKIHELSVLNKIKVKKEEEPITIRIVRPGRVHDIWKDYMVTNDNEIKVRETPFSSYGYLITSRSCYNGTLHYDLFGEERVEEIPIRKRPGIEFPVGTNSESSEHEIFIQRENSDIKRSIKIKVSGNSVVDLCTLL